MSPVPASAASASAAAALAAGDSGNNDHHHTPQQASKKLYHGHDVAINTNSVKYFRLTFQFTIMVVCGVFLLCHFVIAACLTCPTD
jgi:hypothetical protein